MKFILGTKKEMTQIFSAEGEVFPVTAIKAGPCIVAQAKTTEKDRYAAVQIGYGKRNNISKSLEGHLKPVGRNLRYLREFQGNEDVVLKVGDEFGIEIFKEGDIVDVSAISKGKGFQGVVKRHGFKGSPASHGHKDQLRMPGSIGSTGPQHVFKGLRMAGRMGGGNVTIKNLEVIKIDAENDLIYIKGAIPGAYNSLVEIRGKGEMKIRQEVVKEKNEKEEIGMTRG
ncbi:MAG: 50S ribosomal protein L3 [bacterium]